ncbi:MAG: peptide ABC transporter substrate-binding protein [Gemmatimonadaceae bacterium]
MRTKLFLLLTSSIALVGCGGREGPASTSATGGTLVVATAADAATIFPPHVFDQVGAAIRDNLYDRLADIGDDLNTVGDKGFTPRLADSWDWSRDSLSIAFHLNPRARWHDGQPVRANDVRYSWRLFTDPKVGASPSAEIANIDSVTLRDSLTPVVWYKQRRPEAFYDFVYQVYIVPEHVFQGVPPEQLRTSELTRKGIGSGRFRLARWEAGQRIELVADTGNYHGRAKLDRVIWSIVPDAGASLAQLLGGQADFLEFVPPDQVHLLDSSKTVRAAPFPSLQYAFLGFNLVDPKNPSRPHQILGDVRVRRALSMALDRKAMLQNVFAGIGRASYGPFPRSISFADTSLPLPQYDLNAAKALLDSAGWRESSPGAVRARNGQPLRLSLIFPVSSRPRIAYSVLIQEQLRRAGVQVDLEQMQANTMGERQFKHNFDLALLAQFTDPSPSGYKQQWGSAGVPPAGQNWVSYRNPRYDMLLDSALTTMDAAKQAGYMHRAFQIQVADAPAVWLYDVPTVAGIQRRIHNAPMRPDGWSIHLADWTIPPNERIARDRVGLGPVAR